MQSKWQNLYKKNYPYLINIWDVIYIYIYIYICYIYMLYIYVIYIYIYIYIYIGTQWKCTKRWKQSSATKQSETVWNSVTRHIDVHWLPHRCYMDEHNVCSVTSEPSKSSCRRVSSCKDSPALLNKWEVSFTKAKSF